MPPCRCYAVWRKTKYSDDWLKNYIFPAEAKNVTADFVTAGTRMACVEMVLAGITTYTDMYYFEDTEAEAAKEVGLRGVLGQTIIGFPAPDYRTWQDALNETERLSTALCEGRSHHPGDCTTRHLFDARRRTDRCPQAGCEVPCAAAHSFGRNRPRA